jgi:hypothetical protein
MRKYYLIAIVMVSCMELPDPIEITKEVHDTTFIETIKIDTTYIDNIIRDTTFVTVIDTMYIDRYVHDTVYLEKVDTVYIDKIVETIKEVPIKQPIDVTVKLLSESGTQQQVSTQVTVVNWGEATRLEINELGDCVGYIDLEIVE